MKKFSALSLAILLSLGLHAAQAQTPVGEVKGTATAHTEASAKGVIAGAQLVLPAQATGGAGLVTATQAAGSAGFVAATQTTGGAGFHGREE